MKIQKLIISVITFIIIFIIYILSSDKKINYVALGDDLSKSKNSYSSSIYGYNEYINEYLEKNNLKEKKLIINKYNTGSAVEIYKSLTNDINIDEFKKLKSSLRSSDIVVLSMSHKEIYENKNNKSLLEEEITSIEKTLKEIKKYAKEDIILLSFYNSPYSRESSSKTNIEDINQKLQLISNDLDICLLDLNNLLQDKKYFDNPRNYLPNYKGYEVISNAIIEKIENVITNNSCNI